MNYNHMTVTLLILLIAALALAGAAAVCAKTRFPKNPAAKNMTIASGSRLLRLLEFSGCMASILRGRLGLAAGGMRLGWGRRMAGEGMQG